MADLPKERMRVHTLVRVDTRTMADDQSEIRVFIPLRNEVLRLPQTLAYYRKLGVARFFVVDNGSTDGSKEFLLAQPDCHVFVTHNSFAEAGCSVEWLNALLDEYGTNHWCLTVDADEWFVYPGCERRPLSDFAAYLERSGAEGVFAFLLDMYGSGRIAEANPDPQLSFLDSCRYFDREYDWRHRSYVAGLESSPFPEYDVLGGPRLRLFLPNIRRYYHLMRALWRAYYLLRLPLPLALNPPPRLTKIPLVHWLPGTRYEHNHATTPIKLSETTGVLLHFKFLQDFYARVVDEVNRKEHWGEATEYTRYLAKLRRNPALTFYYEGSVQYEDTEQLVRLGLLREDRDWRQLRASIDSSGGEPASMGNITATTQPFVVA
jgi:glycosyltransferase involved in cell wall biosynthesis